MIESEAERLVGLVDTSETLSSMDPDVLTAIASEVNSFSETDIARA